MQKKIVRSFLIFLCSVAPASILRAGDLASSPPVTVADGAQTAASYEALQNLFDHRCIECHSCTNAPCQLKLTSYAGLQRGASKIEAIDSTRLLSIAPTRLGIDARSPAEWHQDKGFFPVSGAQHNIILSIINKGQPGSPSDAVADSHVCPANDEEAKGFAADHPDKLMPYGLPPLTAEEQAILVHWAEKGREPVKKDQQDRLSPELKAARDVWLKFLNEQDLEHRLLARYLYEHLFTASIQFQANSTEFYRLIRSKSTCDGPLNEIATRRPTDDPQQTFHYCFQHFAESVVEKTLLPYTLDEPKLEQIKDIFFKEPWKASGWPDYQAVASNNPFIIYQDIPVKARYRFLLEDAHYHVSTFIKGPVCYGSGAVSSIDEHFFIFFINPDSELMIRDPAFAKQSESLLMLPFADDSDTRPAVGAKLKEMLKTLVERTGFTDKYIEARNKYVKLKYSHVLQTFPRGYQLSDLWNGAGSNPNAVLTVFRHFDSSYVLDGLRGGEATSYFVVDYGLFERLVYNLVVGFDIFGNLSHQIHTRVYMGMIRREAEDNFLLLLPVAERARLRSKWYHGGIAKLGEAIFYDPDDIKLPTQIPYGNGTETDKQLIGNLANHYFTAAVRGPYDGTPHAEFQPLAGMSGRPAIKAPFVNLFPDSSLILIESGGTLKTVVTAIRDRAHNNLGMMVGESVARVPQQDKIAIVTGLATSYPNLFFVVEEAKISTFLHDLYAVQDRPSAKGFLAKWGVLNTNPQFWAKSDALHAYLQKLNSVEYGVLDYTRYGLWTEKDDWH